MKKRFEIDGVAIFFFGLLTVIFALQMPVGTFRAAGSGLFPLCLGMLLMGLSGIWIMKSLIKPVSKKPGADSSVSGSTVQIIYYLGAIVLAVLLLRFIGYLLFCAFLMLLLLIALGIKSPARAMLLAMSTAIASYLLFVRWLQVPLPKGWPGL